MNRATKTMLLSGRGRKFGFEYEDWRGGDHRNSPESRFRDRDGREHYDDGRYAPMGGAGNMWVENRRDSRGRYAPARSEYGGEGRDMPQPDVWYGRYPAREIPRGLYAPYLDGGEHDMNVIGFSGDGGFRGDPGMDASYRPMNELEHRSAPMQPGHSSSSAVAPMDKRTADQWASKMENTDGTRGPHWTMEQTKQLQAQKNVNCDELEFWVAMNMMYSDYIATAKKYSLGGNIDFFVDMAKAFLNDKDAQPDKLARYYAYIVRH